MSAKQTIVGEGGQGEERRRLRRVGALLRDAGLRHRLLVGAGALVLALVSVLAFFVYQLQTLPWDVAATLELQALRATPFRNFMYLVSLPGYLPWAAYVVGASALGVGVWLGWRHGAYLGTLVALQGVANSLIKTAIGRPRPQDTLVEVFLANSGNSFPSGHVMFYTVFWGFLFFLAWARLPRGFGRGLALVVTGALVLLVGPSRIYLGAHWLSDVIAAYGISLVILAVGIEVYAARLLGRRAAAG